MCYYPIDYPILKIQHKSDAPLISVILAGPRKMRVHLRDIHLSDLESGANEATELNFKDVKSPVKTCERKIFAVRDTVLKNGQLY